MSTRPEPGSPLDERPERSTVRPVAAAAGTAGVHGALVGMALLLPAAAVPGVQAAGLVTRWVEVPVEVAPEPAPAPPEPAAPPAPRAPRPAADPTETAGPPPAAAASGQVLAQSPEDEVLDFGDSFVMGAGATYAGGFSANAGTATTAVRDADATGDGVGRGRGTGAACERRPAALTGGARWDDCPFPEEADRAGIDRARVGLRVRVTADGRVEAVDVTEDPGDGFAREARRCALRARWRPATECGEPVASTVTTLVAFERR